MAERRPIALVVGAGIGGLACALALGRRFAVTVIDPGGRENASRVAAGMLAPEAEAATDPLAPPLPLMREALALWPGFTAAVGAGVALHGCGTLILDHEAPNGDAAWRAVSAAEARKLQPALAGSLEGRLAFAEADARIDVAALMRRLEATLGAAGATRLRAEVVGVHRRGVILTRGEALSGDVVVAAAGVGLRAFARNVPEAAVLEPIKGQIVRFAAGPAGDGAMVRGRGGYLCPGRSGAVFGASMEAGRDDRSVDPTVIARLAEAAEALAPGLTDGVGTAGVRAATPDGLPLVGWSTSGVLLAGGFRRNGWLLAPLAAEMIAAYAAGADPGAWGAALDPGRVFSPGRR